MSVVFISHKLDEVMEVADNVTIFRDGNKVGDFSGRELNEKKLSYYMTGRNIEYSRYQRSTKGRRAGARDKRTRTQTQLREDKPYSQKRRYCRHYRAFGLGKDRACAHALWLNPQDSGTMLLNGKSTGRLRHAGRGSRCFHAA